MEDWVDAIKMRLQGEQLSLPPEDWERFKADYFGRKKKRQILPLGLALAVAAGLAIVLLVNKPASDAIVAPIVENSFHDMTSDANASIKQEEVLSSVNIPEPIIDSKEELAVSIPIPVEVEVVRLENETEKGTRCLNFKENRVQALQKSLSLMTSFWKKSSSVNVLLLLLMSGASEGMPPFVRHHHYRDMVT